MVPVSSLHGLPLCAGDVRVLINYSAVYGDNLVLLTVAWALTLVYPGFDDCTSRYGLPSRKFWTRNYIL